MDSTCISTLCLSSLHSVFVTRTSSIIIYVLLSMASYRRTRLRGNPKVATLPRVRTLDHASPRKRLRGNPAGTLKVATLPRVRTLDHANPRKGLRGSPAGTPKVATLPRVRALDHANPRKGLRGAPKSCNFTSRSGARPCQSMQRVARGA